MKLSENQKDSLLKVFFFGAIQLIVYLLYLFISAISGDFNWTIERLTSSTAGTFISVLRIILLINGVILFVYVVIFLILLIKS